MSAEHDKLELSQLQREADRVKPRSKVSVLGYVTILFVAAFLLLIMSYFMQQRNNEAVISGLKASVSAMQSLEGLQNEKDRLAEQVKVLEANNELLDNFSQEQSSNLSDTTAALSQKEKELQATDWLRQIQTLYAMKYYKAARTLIAQFQETELASFLPMESVVPDKASPSEDYAAILEALY